MKETIKRLILSAIIAVILLVVISAVVLLVGNLTLIKILGIAGFVAFTLLIYGVLASQAAEKVAAASLEATLLVPAKTKTTKK